MGNSRVAASLTALTCAAAFAAAPAYGEDAATNTFVPGDHAVELSLASGQGTPLAPGLYSATLPVDASSRYVEVKRGEGERLSVSINGSASWKGNAWSVDSGSQGLQLTLTTADGATTCGSDSDSLTSSGTPGLLATHVDVDEAKTARTSSSLGSGADACLAATSYRLEIKRTIDGDNATPMPVQIAVKRTPRVNGTVKVPAGEVPDMTTQALEASTTATAGDGFANATILRPGGYTVKTPIGRRMFFRVHLSWGQRMSFGWQAPKNGTTYNPSQDLNLSMQMFNPSLVSATLSGAGTSSGYLFESSSDSGSKDLGVYTAPIDYGNANVDSSGSDALQWHSDPGWYYVVLDVTPSSSTPKPKLQDSSEFDSVLSVRVTGTPNAGPSMAVQQPEPGNVSGVGKSSANPLLWGGALVLGIGAVVGLGYVLRRREKH